MLFLTIYNKDKCLIILKMLGNICIYYHYMNMAEINKMIDYYSSIKFPYSRPNKRFNKIKKLKEFKRLIIINHIARLRDDIGPCNYIWVFFLF